VKPFSAEEVLDIAELRLTLISLTLKPVHRSHRLQDSGGCRLLRSNITRLLVGADESWISRGRNTSQSTGGFFSGVSKEVLAMVRARAGQAYETLGNSVRW
jgi:hypothetical protein